ncbi:hypothetical protein FRC12_011790 [Ceratobasidium sp. 428]|nr:hypothetical protein FRC12_011790 [Ceratobasidium sp. 428]
MITKLYSTTASCFTSKTDGAFLGLQFIDSNTKYLFVAQGATFEAGQYDTISANVVYADATDLTGTKTVQWNTVARGDAVIAILKNDFTEWVGAQATEHAHYSSSGHTKGTWATVP